MTPYFTIGSHSTRFYLRMSQMTFEGGDRTDPSLSISLRLSTVLSTVVDEHPLKI